MKIKTRLKIILKTVFRVILFLTFIFLSPSYQKTEKPSGPKEKDAIRVVSFVSSAPIVTAGEKKPKDSMVISISADFRPFTFLNDEGKPAGMFVDIWRLWAQKTGKHIEFMSSDWNSSIENLKNQKADIHSGLLLTPERLEWMNGSQPFYEAGVSLFYPIQQGRITDISALSGQTVAVLRGGHPKQYLGKSHPNVRLFVCDTREELVKVTREGKTKGFVIVSQVGKSIVDQMGLSGEFETYDRVLYREKFHAGVLKMNTELLILVDKGLNAISSQELSEIEARWVPDPAKRYYKTPGHVRLSPEEETWLKKHKTIRVGMSPVVPPLKFSEKGIIKGIEPDYLNLLSEYTGIQFEYVVCDFPMMDAKVKSGEIDMFISFYIPERLAYMTFTEPLMDFKQVIIARTDAPFISGIGALKGKKIATIKGVKLYEKILSPYPEIEVIQVGNSEEMFKAVSEFKADALITRTYIAGYVMHNYPNLKITGIADIPPEPYLYAIRKDYPELVTILNKAIASITREKHDEIVQRWFSVRIDYRPNWSEIWKWAFVIGGTFSLLLGLSLLWNRRLSKEIDKRKQAEEGQQEVTRQLERSNIELQQFAYVASHDLQEPLRMISSYLQLLEQRYKDKLDNKANLFIHYAVDGAKRLQSLINGLLEYSRIKTHGEVFAKVDVTAVLHGVCRNLEPLINESGAAVRYDQLPIIQADEAQIAQLFQNLIQNALKFRRKQIQPAIEITAEKNDGQYVFCVCDNGIGIEKQYFERIFTIFQRLHTREEYPGSGLGLSICKQIVERHRGSIWVKSTPNEGTSFYFSIPEEIQ